MGDWVLWNQTQSAKTSSSDATGMASGDVWWLPHVLERDFA